MFNIYFVFGFDSLAEDVAVQIDLLQIRENGLTILQHSQRDADLHDVIRSVGEVVQDQVGEIDEGVVVYFSGEILARQRGIGKLTGHLFALRADLLFLTVRENESEFAHVVERIADLMCDAERDQDVRRQVAVHMRVQVAAEFVLTADIGLEDGFLHAVAVVFGLAHQRLGDGGNGRLALDPPIGKNIGDLCSAEAQDPHIPVVAIDVRRDLAADHLQALVVDGERQLADGCEIPDQVAGMMIRCLHLIEETVIVVAVQIDDHIFFIIQIKPAEAFHNISIL